MTSFVPGQMMEAPLLVSSLLAHAESYHGDTEIVSRTVEGPSADNGGAIRNGVHRYTYAQAARRSRQLANALAKYQIEEYEEFDQTLIQAVAEGPPEPRYLGRVALARLLVPYPAGDMASYRVSTRVNSVKNDSPDLVFLEFSLNDGHPSNEFRKATVEGIVRQLWSLLPSDPRPPQD